MDFHEYEDGSGYEARFTTCGICRLMTEVGLKKLIPAMCRLDYTMSEAGGVTDFVREYTLASGGLSDFLLSLYNSQMYHQPLQ